MPCLPYKEFTEVKTTKIKNWRVKYLGGTKKEWVYLTDEEAAKWPLSDLEKYNLGLPNMPKRIPPIQHPKYEEKLATYQCRNCVMILIDQRYHRGRRLGPIWRSGTVDQIIEHKKKKCKYFEFVVQTGKRTYRSVGWDHIRYPV
ncbi:hypothetical protein BDQ17DRAFT_1432810 [Cyathus striatus]|nr:hypothetical protein BDQ17DRAFT_1432810 [Cyathus striatus]